MSRRVRGKRFRWLALLLVLLVGLLPATTQAHLDPQTDPTTIIDVVEINRVFLTEDMDDGFDGDAELLLVVDVQHPGHDFQTHVFEDDYDWDSGKPWLPQPTLLYTHVECKPRAPISVVMRMVQVDSDLQTATIWGVISGIGSWAVAGAKAGPKGAAAGFVVGFLLSMAGVLDENEDLGMNFAAIPENGPVWVKLRGPDGGADLRFYGRTGVTDDDDCTPPPPPETSLLTPGERTGLLFDPMQEGLAVAMALAFEPGGSSYLTEQRVADIRQTYTRMLLGAARAATALEIEDAVGLQGVDGAIELYQAGLALDREDPAGALAAYRQAFLQAATAYANGTEADTMSLPFQLSLTPDFISTRVGRQPEIVAVVHGATGPGEIWIEGLPVEAEATVSANALEVPVFRIGFDLTDVPPGRYPLTVNAAGEDGTVSQEVTIVVNPQPDKLQKGVVVPSETTGGVTTATINPARDQAIVGPGDAWQLKLPAGSLPGTGETEISVSRMSGPRGVELPPGARALNFAFALAAPGEPFSKAASMVVDPAVAGVTGVTDPAKLSLLQVLGDGSVRLVPGRSGEAGANFALEGPGTYVLVEMAITFDDLIGHWVRADVELMAAKEIIRGVGPGRFDPAGLVTRAQFAALLARAMGLKPVVGEPLFSDVQPSDWFFGEVNAAAQAGLVQGAGDGTFLPNALVTREQAGVMLARATVAAGKSLAIAPDEAAAMLASFPDRDLVSSWATVDLALAVKETILRGNGAGELTPGATASRAEAAAMIARFWQQ